MVVLLALLAVAAGLVGVMLASQVTSGVAVVGLGCLLAILARIAQADRQHQQAHPELFKGPQQPIHAGPYLSNEQIASNRRSDKTVAALAGGAVILIVVAAMASQFFPSPGSASAPAVTASSGDSLSFTVTETLEGWHITNDSNFLLNVCWAERQGQRASVPTMIAQATVTVMSAAFRNIGGAHEGADLRITCSVNGGNTTGSIRRK